MNRYPYLRAYMAGFLFPSWLLVAVIGGIEVFRIPIQTPPPSLDLERILILAMAVIPNVWGLWNMLYFAAGLRRRLPLGAWGALFALVVFPIGVFAVRTLGGEQQWRQFSWTAELEVLPVAIGVYFLVWKFIVAFFNRVVELGS